MRWWLFAVILMAGCSHGGFMPEKYDGEALEVDRAAITAYEENNILITEDLPERFPFTKGTEIAGIQDETGAEMQLEAGTYDVGTDVPPGRYDALLQDAAGALVIEDDQGVRLLEIPVGVRTPVAQVDLAQGYTMTFASRDGELALAPVENDMMEMDGQGYIELPAGTHTVGTHVPAGEYELLSESLPIMGDGGLPRIYWNPSPMMPGLDEDMEDVEGVPTEMKAGDTIVTEYPLQLKKIE